MLAKEIALLGTVAQIEDLIFTSKPRVPTEASRFLPALAFEYLNKQSTRPLRAGLASPAWRSNLHIQEMAKGKSKLGASGAESFLLTHGVSFTCAAFYIAANILLFTNAARTEYYRHENFQRYTNPIARGCGAIMNLNFAAVLLVASRSLVSFLRETPIALIVSLDHLMPDIHSLLGMLLLCSGFLHTFVQGANFIILDPWASGYGEANFLFATGILLCIFLFTIRVSSWDSIRRKHHETFRRFHISGSVAMFAVLLLHGQHQKVPSTWKWVVFPISLWILDYVIRLLRERRSYLFINKHSALFQGQSVLRLRLPKVFHYEPGQYAELKVPTISKLQWHPFTIASSPHEAEMVFYVKASGDWTTELFELFAQRLGDSDAADIEVHIAGPFGAPAQHIDQFDRLVLIGGGVGATPFCSVVKSLDNYMIQWLGEVDVQQGRDQRSIKHVSRKIADVQPANRPRKATAAQVGFAESADLSSNSNSAYYTPQFTDPNLGQLSVQDLGGPSDRNDTRGVQFYSESNVVQFASQEDVTRSESLAASIREGDIIPGPRPDDRAVTKSEWLDLSESTPNSNQRTGYWQAINSLYDGGNTMQSAVYNESVGYLMQMSYGSPEIIRKLQSKHFENKSRADFSLYNSTNMNPVDDMSVFQDKQFRFLVYMKSVTANMALLWILLLRVFAVGLAGIFGHISLVENGLSIYKATKPLLIFDTIMAAIIASAVVVPAIVEAVVLRTIALVDWWDLFIFTPVVVFGLVIDILALNNVGQNIDFFGIFTLIVIWPLTGILFMVRLVRVIGERVALGDHRTHGKLSTAKKQVDFLWTTPTTEDDSWLVEEFNTNARSPNTKLHRYVTRGLDPADVDLDNGAPTKITVHEGRPNWTEVLNEIALSAPSGSSVGVFLCGPKTMADQVSHSVQDAMRNSIVRGLQTGTPHVKRSLEELFGEEIKPNEYTNDSVESGETDSNIGCNIRMVYHKERFS